MRPVVKPIDTPRLLLRPLTLDDAPFILNLLNEPSFIEFIGDKGVRDLEGARNYLTTGPIPMYAKHGVGLCLVLLKDSGEPLGMCGLIHRENLDDIDVGFAFLPQYWSKGYAFESASAWMEYGQKTLGLNRIVGITSPKNHGSIRVLEKLGLKFEKLVRLSDDRAHVKLFG